ncbi:RHS repeat-associated protein [Pseudarthrobacter sulfonivorans]|nr:RHS repeat-associated protein [Pseudarthrobacter sulfonivorans]
MLNSTGKPDEHARTLGNLSYSVLRYQPRIESSFARIERWTRSDGDVHWRSISRENISSVYGLDLHSRIADPDDPLRIFSWLICASYDNKGNATEYEYVPESSDGVDLAAAHERHRTDQGRSANRLLKAVHYGNRDSQLVYETLAPDRWMFTLVLDYGEHDMDNPAPHHSGRRPCRQDPFSRYRSGFEVRTYRLCRRALMFHHFPDEAVGANCLVRSMAFTYRQDGKEDTADRPGQPLGSVLESVTVSGHRTDPAGGYMSHSLPPLELDYTEAVLSDQVHTLDAASLENLPAGIGTSGYEFVDLDGDSTQGILTAHGEWYYKPALGDARFGALQSLPRHPSVSLTERHTQLLDLAGDGSLDVVQFTGPAPGFFERNDDGWSPHRPFVSMPQIDWADPNLALIDLTGDGLADVMITEGDALIWYPSLGEDGFGPGRRISVAKDEDHGPRIILSDGTGTIFRADVSGDGLMDLVRIRNGEICYWPGLGRTFGAKVTMDNAPHFDRPELFDPARLRVADFDGNGLIDVMYLAGSGVDLYRNQMGNGWAPPTSLAAFPPISDITSVRVADLFGRGTACLVWSSELAADTARQIRYVDLMGEKPHLLRRIRNNLGAETLISYSTSTIQYLADKAAGRPWVTKVPFTVHVVAKVEMFDHVNRTRFVSRHRYRNGRFDGPEREFCGFAMTEREDTEQFAALVGTDELPTGVNIDPISHVPPVLTKTWFHTGAFVDREQLSTFLEHEYYPPPHHALPEAPNWRLDDSVLDGVTTLKAEREACRALKGRPLRQEIYALDGSDLEPHPYSVVEYNYTVRQLQEPAKGRPGVFAVDPRETVTATCERQPAQARVAHELVLDVDPFGTVLNSVTIAYRRPVADTALPQRTQEVQATTLLMQTLVRVTRIVDTSPDAADRHSPADRDSYRVPQAYDVSSRQISGSAVDAASARLARSEVTRLLQGPLAAGLTSRLVSRQRIQFAVETDPHTARPFGQAGPLGIVHQSFTLAMPQTLVNQVYGNRIAASDLRAAGYVWAGSAWWLPSGTVRYTPPNTSAPAAVADFARKHFFLPRRFVDPFAAAAGLEHGVSVEYDLHDLLVVETVDALSNRITAGERAVSDERLSRRLDYRTLAASLITDPNRNRTAVVRDALGRVSATAVMGKPEDDTQDRAVAVDTDPNESVLAAFWADPQGQAAALLGSATTRFVYDTDAYMRTRTQSDPQPCWIAALARERHVEIAGAPSPVQLSISFHGSTGQEIQNKMPAEPEVLPGGGRGPSRWVTTGWVVLNNKGKPVRQYEPFFSGTNEFEFAAKAGVSPVLLYDPLGRLVATLHPHHVFHKTIYGVWGQTVWDVNDTIAISDPRQDADVGTLLARLPEIDVVPTWYRQRSGGALGIAERTAAERTLWHADTPSRVELDPLGRPVLTIGHNRTPPDRAAPARDGWHRAFSVLGVNGDEIAVLDCPDDAPGPTTISQDRLVARYTNDRAGRRLLEESMEAGSERALYDVVGQLVMQWRPVADPAQAGVEQRTAITFDRLRRPVDTVLTLNGSPSVTERRTYGEGAPDAAVRNLRGQVWQLRDQAGLVTTAYDVQGNAVSASLQLAREYRGIVDWTSATPEKASHVSIAEYDAIKRLKVQHHPDGTAVHHSYDVRGMLRTVRAELPGQPLGQIFVRDIRYDAHGRRTIIDLGNGVRTTHTYDPLTFRLLRLETSRGAAKPPGGPYFPQDEPVPPDKRRGVQNLTYTYDPGGNITNIVDDAQPRVFNLNTKIDASTDYVYDALYRLVESRGREHLGLQSAQLRPPTPTGWNDIPRVNPADRQALGLYAEHFNYDTAGNLLELRHSGLAPGAAGWRRVFTYRSAAQLPQSAGIFSNRLTSTTVFPASGPPLTETYTFDAHGCQTALPPMQSIIWNFRGQLASSTRQVVSTAMTPQVTYYAYGVSGDRVRKVRDRSGAVPSPESERIYFGNYEVYREFSGSTALSRTSVHIMDGQQRVAVIETRSGSAPLVRYQLSNHLGSATGELDQAAEWISYEEYYPYGSTALSFIRNGVPPKRYRYTTKERDEETGLSYHSARYYAPWLCRWTSADPSAPDANRYWYVGDSPAMLSDATGRYGTAGHYYTVLFVSLAAGFSPQRAFENAFFAQLPDQIESVHAVSAGLRFGQGVANNMGNAVRSVAQDAQALPSGIGEWLENGFRGLLGVSPGMNEERLSRDRQRHSEQEAWSAIAANTADVQSGFHVLNSRSTATERPYRQAITLSLSGDPVGQGLSLHPVGDSYAHSMLDDPKHLYPPVTGHSIELWEGHEPDKISRRPRLYENYVLSLTRLLSKVTGRTPLLGRQLRDFVDAVAAAPEEEQPGVIRDLIRKQFGIEPPAYRPENHAAGTLDDVRQQPDVINPGLIDPSRSYRNPIPSNLTENALLNYARDWR